MTSLLEIIIIIMKEEELFLNDKSLLEIIIIIMKEEELFLNDKSLLEIIIIIMKEEELFLNDKSLLEIIIIIMKEEELFLNEKSLLEIIIIIMKEEQHSDHGIRVQNTEIITLFRWRSKSAMPISSLSLRTVCVEIFYVCFFALVFVPSCHCSPLVPGPAIFLAVRGRTGDRVIRIGHS